ncbi:MAG: MaoC family dehydratase [Gemmatimonadota bacterium]
MTTIAQLKNSIGTETVSDWRLIDQAMVNAHAALTGDDDPIHSDIEWATKQGPFGGTIVQGFLTLSHFTLFARQAMGEPIEDVKFSLNYGFDKVRYVRPVLTGKRVRARFRLLEITDKGDRAVVKYGVTVEVEGSDNVHVAAEWLFSAQR